MRNLKVKIYKHKPTNKNLQTYKSTNLQIYKPTNLQTSNHHHHHHTYYL